MTGVAAMTVMTTSAEARLDGYLSQVRQALDAHPDVSADDVATDIREHIDTEFADLGRPVTLGELDAVLARLGPPSQWASAGANSLPAPGGAMPFDWKGLIQTVRRRALGVVNALWRGPEDWRLPYLPSG